MDTVLAAPGALGALSAYAAEGEPLKKLLAIAAMGSLVAAVPSTAALAGTSAASGTKLSSTPSQSISVAPNNPERGCGYGMTRPRLVLQPESQTVRRGHGTYLKARKTCNGKPVKGAKVTVTTTTGSRITCTVTNAQGVSICRVSRVFHSGTATGHTGGATSNTVKIFVTRR